MKADPLDDDLLVRVTLRPSWPAERSASALPPIVAARRTIR